MTCSKVGQPIIPSNHYAFQRSVPPFSDDKPTQAARGQRGAERLAQTVAQLAALFERHERVFLEFSGGKDSLTLAHLCEPWRDRLTLLWTNTGFMAAHMVDFVRAYRDQLGFRLVELSPASPMLDNWRTFGPPVDILPLAHTIEAAKPIRTPRVQPWLACCAIHRGQPPRDFLARFAAPCAVLNGQRKSDHGATPDSLGSVTPANAELCMPIWSWSDADVMDFIREQGIALPSHYATFADSIECVICPGDLSRKRIQLLDERYPEAAAFVRATAGDAIALVRAAADELSAILAPAAAPEVDTP